MCHDYITRKVAFKIYVDTHAHSTSNMMTAQEHLRKKRDIFIYTRLCDLKGNEYYACKNYTVIIIREVEKVDSRSHLFIKGKAELSAS